MPTLTATNGKSFLSLFIVRLVRVSLLLALLSLVLVMPQVANAQAQSQSFTITFYGVPVLQSGVLQNISQYTKIFTGTFQIARSALGIQNNLILYRDSAFLSFDIPITTAAHTYDFNLGNPGIKFPGDSYPFNAGTQTDPLQGLRLDANGAPKRFDTPSTSAGNSAEIRDYTTDPWPGGPRPEFTLVDNDSLDFVELADGTLLSRNALAGRIPVASVGGNWSFSAGQGDSATYSGIYIITSGPVMPPQPGKQLGDNTGKTGTPVTTCSPAVDDPIDIASGNMFYAVADCATSGQNPLRFTRYYNSLAGTDTFAASLGRNWRSSFDRYLKIVSATSVSAERADGKVLTFTLSGSTWTPDTDVDLKLVQAGSTWTMTDPDDSVETYAAISGTEAILTSVTARNGYTQTLQYNSSNQLQSVTDSFNRSLNFTYQNGLLTTLTTPDNLVLTFGYDSISGVSRPVSVAYSTSPQTSQTYLYENSGLPFALTGVVDENANRYATWTYDPFARGLTTQHGSGADIMTIVYNDSDGSRTVTNALGVTDTYTFTTLQGVPKVTQISRAATSTTAAAVELVTYDSNGFVASRTDWNGNQTVYVNDARGEPISITEASGTPQTRTTAITYDTTFHLPTKIVQPGVTTDLAYDTSGNLLTRTLTDTTTTTAPYATGGSKRTWTYTWANSLLASSKGPRTDVNATTTYNYDSSAALTKITNALGQSVQITQHTPGGLPQTIVDPNGVTTQLTYDVRQRLTSRTVNTAAGALTTSYVHDPAGNLLSTTLPDGSALTNAYDAAHRLIKVTDALGNYTSYTLDALGDRTQVNIYKGDGTLTWQRSGTFDALGRELVDTTGAGETTTRTYDPNGNVLTIADGLNHTTAKTYDALNRLSTSTDANAGATTFAYDSRDRIVSVTDANNNSTAYVRDGFGDVIQQTSPDSGTAVFHYDGDANLASKTDALGIVTNQTFDALDRPLTTTYPADTVENVVYTYDQTGTGFTFGIGRLTSVTDAAGSLTRTYDERGNLATEKRINGSTTLTTSYTYDGASRVASMTYPDGTLVTYQHDAAGYLAKVSAKPAGSSTTTTIATLSHQPFGPINAATYGNGIAETWAMDNAYRPTNITDALTGANLQNLTYAYDNAGNVTSITDALNAANSQTLGYDAVNRLTSAVSGTGGYGSYSWTYDKVGNRLTQVQGATTTTYGYTPGTNRLATITPGTATAMLQAPKKMKPQSGPGLALSAKASPAAKPATRTIKQSIANRRSSTMLAGILGWPMLLVGFAGVMGFRRRLLSDRRLAITVFALLTGGTTILIGCGGGTNAGSILPTPTASTPTFSPAGGTFTAAQTVTISDATAGATIYYTTDGTTPSANSTKYTGPITVSNSETIEAIAVASGYTNSAVATATYTINIPLPTVATPTFSPASGTYAATQTVTISDSTAGATIYYTTNGTTPSTSSTQYTSPVTVSSSETIKAIAAAAGYTNSAVATANYTINIPLPTVATPTFSPASGTFTAAQIVTISDSTAGTTIYFTTDGTTPNTSSTQFTGPITVSSSETIKAIAAASGYTNSAVATANYTINLPLPTVATPTFSPAGGTFTAAQAVTISDSTAGATIYYTTDGTTPTTSSTMYTSPITVSSSETIEAIAAASGYTNSAVATATYTINLPTVVTVTTNANGNITSIPPANSTAYATFTYNNANRLASVTGSPMGATFVYDWAGQRFSKTNPGSTPVIYSYAQGGTLIAENDNGAVTDYIYADGRPIAILQPSATPAANQVSYVLADRLGTPQLVSNSSGAIVWSTTYQPFGTTGLINGSINQNLRFPGQLADAETGFSYNLNRDYMPNLGRYLESDPIGLAGGENVYQYALVNPLKYSDWFGTESSLEYFLNGYEFGKGFSATAEERYHYVREFHNPFSVDEYEAAGMFAADVYDLTYGLYKEYQENKFLHCTKAESIAAGEKALSSGTSYIAPPFRTPPPELYGPPVPPNLKPRVYAPPVQIYLPLYLPPPALKGDTGYTQPSS